MSYRNRTFCPGRAGDRTRELLFVFSHLTTEQERLPTCKTFFKEFILNIFIKSKKKLLRHFRLAILKNFRDNIFITFCECAPRGQFYKTFLSVIYGFFVICYSVCPCPGKLFQPSLMFAGKAGAYPSEALFRFSTLG